MCPLSNINTQQTYRQTLAAVSHLWSFLGGDKADFEGVLVSVSLSSAFIIYIMLSHVGKYQCTYLGAYVYGLIYIKYIIPYIFLSYFS